MSNLAAVIRLTASDDGVSSTIDKANNKLGSLGSSLNDGLKDSVGKAFSVKSAFSMLKGTMEEVLNRAKQYQNLGERMGIPATEVAKLDKAAERAGINVASVAKGMQLVQKFGAEGLGGATAKAKDLTVALGATPEQLTKLRAGGTQSLAEVADMMNKIGDAGKRDAIGIKIFGEKWGEMKQMIGKGGQAIRDAGDDQNTWGEDTQKSLVDTQKAWSNMWNDISVAVADFLAALAPVIGALRFLGNIVMVAVKIAVMGLASGFDALGIVLIGIAELVLYASGLFLIAGDTIEKLDKKAAELTKRINKRSEETLKSIEKEGEGVSKAFDQMVGNNKSGTPAQTIVVRLTLDAEEFETALKSLTEKYEDALKRMDNTLTLSNDWEKVDVMKEQLALLERQLMAQKELQLKAGDITSIRAGQKAMEEKAFEIAKKKKDIEKEIHAGQLSSIKRLLEKEDMANERKIAQMKNSGASEEEIEDEKLAQQMRRVARLQEVYERTKKDKMATAEDEWNAQKDLAKALSDTEDLVAEKNKRNAGGSAVTNSLQAIGGGGAVTVTSVAQEQLDVAKENLDVLKQIRDIWNNTDMTTIGEGTFRSPSLK